MVVTIALPPFEQGTSMTKDEVLKLALECLDGVWRGDYSGNAKEVITAIKEALANEALEKMAENARELGLDYEPEQDWIERERAVGYREGHRAALAQRTWVGLTPDERIELAQDVDWAIGAYCEYAEKIEANLKEKNT